MHEIKEGIRSAAAAARSWAQDRPASTRPGRQRRHPSRLRAVVLSCECLAKTRGDHMTDPLALVPHSPPFPRPFSPPLRIATALYEQ